MYNQIEDILLNISIVIATVWIVKRFWGSFFEEKQNSILSVSLWIVYCIFQFFFGYHNGRLQIFATKAVERKNTFYWLHSMQAGR